MSTQEYKANDLIPVLIDRFAQYSNNLKDRVKINGIFAEFDQNARGNLRKFINMSQMRYKCVKSGNSLENILFSQKEKYNDLSKKILCDKFYQTNEIDIEHKKLFRRPDKKENSEICELREKVKQGAKDFSESEVKKRENYFKKAEIKRALKRQQEEQMKFSLENFKYKPKYHDKGAPTNNSFHKEEESEDLNQKKENVDKEKQKFCSSFVDIIKEDEENFKKNINEYHSYLNEMLDAINKGEQLKTNNTTDHPFNFLTENIKLLSYKEDENVKVVKKKKDDSKIDIRKLMRFTKRGKKGNWMTFKVTSTTDTEIPQISFSPESTYTNFRNTIKTVKSEAEKVIKIDENFDQKRETMDNFFKRNELPRIGDYENLIFSKGQGDKWEINNKINEQEIKKTKQKGRRKDIRSGYERAYQKKKNVWNKEDEVAEEKRRREKENRKEINNYLKKIKSLNRSPQLYVDAYSTRDGFTNERLKIFNKTLNGGFYTKKTIENRAANFQLKMEREKRAKSSQVGKRGWEDTNINERVVQKQNQMEDEVMMKIRNNLKEEEEPEDVDLTYKVIAQKIEGRTNEQKLDPYQEYLEFFDLLTKKKEEEIEMEKRRKQKINKDRGSIGFSRKRSSVSSIKSNKDVNAQKNVFRKKRSSQKIEWNPFMRQGISGIGSDNKQGQLKKNINDIDFEQSNNTKLILLEHINN